MDATPNADADGCRGPVEHARASSRVHGDSCGQKTRPGIIWVELYLLYKLHGGAKSSGAPLKSEVYVETEVPQFKAAVRQVRDRCVAVQHEWVLMPYDGPNRKLAAVAVTSNHAAVRGLPCVYDWEAALLVEVVGMKVRITAKIRHAFRRGDLKLSRALMKLRADVKTIAFYAGLLPDWTIPIDRESCVSSLKRLHMDSLICPACG